MTVPIAPRSRGSTPSTSMSLLEMATMGDREAWEQIVYLYSPLVDRWCRRRFLTDDVIQEIGQDVFLKLFKNLGKFRKDDPKFGFRKWLWTLTRNKVFDHLRKIRDQPRCVGGSEGQGIIDNYPDESARPDPGDEGGSTPPDERLILLRRCLELVKVRVRAAHLRGVLGDRAERKGPGRRCQVPGDEVRRSSVHGEVEGHESVARGAGTTRGRNARSLTLASGRCRP